MESPARAANNWDLASSGKAWGFGAQRSVDLAYRYHFGALNASLQELHAGHLDLSPCLAAERLRSHEKLAACAEVGTFNNSHWGKVTQSRKASPPTLNYKLPSKYPQIIGGDGFPITDYIRDYTKLQEGPGPCGHC